VKELSIFTGFS